MKFALAPHPGHSPLAIRGVEASVEVVEYWLRIRWKIDGAMKLIVPPLAGKGRADRLWQTTCFELFVKSPGAASYAEYNLSPSERWAAYDFSGYRDGLSERDMPRQPDCTMRKSTAIAIFDAAIPLAGLPPLPWAASLTAVLEEEGGVKSYWALAHPPGKPDFHDPACFALTVPAPQAA
jgi:hypothetical protein